MKRDQERVERIQAELRESSLDALVCALPNNVLLTCGYWPVVGVSMAMVTREGRVTVLAPEDEKQLAHYGWADEVHTFQAASLKELRSTSEILRDVLATAATKAELGQGTAIGYEHAESYVPAPYAAMHFFGAAIPDLLRAAIPGAKLCPADESLIRLKSVLTSAELNGVRAACRISGAAFVDGAKALRPGLREPELANAFQAGLGSHGKASDENSRAGGWAWCMSGPNAAEASGAFARTRDREIGRGDLVLVHSNSYANGFWTDVTRTFCVGEPDCRQHSIYEAVFLAFRAAQDCLKPGARAADVDHAARSVLKAHGFGKEYKHATGHGVGFSAISHDARPRLHPVSPDVLETGMVFNVEPAVYISGYGGLRHCCMFAVTENGAELLTPFQMNLESLVIAC